MTTQDFILTLFCQIDDQMAGVPKRTDAKLYPSEVDYGNDSCTLHTPPIPPTSWAQGCLLNPSLPFWCNPLQSQ
jgi:hypothetical protein